MIFRKLQTSSCSSCSDGEDAVTQERVLVVYWVVGKNREHLVSDMWVT